MRIICFWIMVVLTLPIWIPAMLISVLWWFTVMGWHLGREVSKWLIN